MPLSSLWFLLVFERSGGSGGLTNDPFVLQVLFPLQHVVPEDAGERSPLRPGPEGPEVLGDA